MKLKTLSILTSILVVISVFVFLNENRRGTDLLAGSDYIKGLDVGKVQKIVLSFKDKKKITLTRDSNKFVLENHKSYPAASKKINDLIYKIASIQVNEKVESGVDEDDLKKFELDNKSNKYLVELFDNDGKKTVSFRVGKSYKGKGNYLYKEGKEEVYLSKSNLFINSSYKDFINTVLLNIKKDDIEKISLSSDKEIELIRKEADFVIASPETKSFKKEKVEEYYKNFTNIKFEEFYRHNDSDVQNLSFDKNIKILLHNKLVYKIGLAKNKDQFFAKLNVLVNEIPKQIVVHQSDGKEKLQSIEDMVKAQGNAQRINMEKGSWVYKIDKSTYEKFVKKFKFFL